MRDKQLVGGTAAGEDRVNRYGFITMMLQWLWRSVLRFSYSYKGSNRDHRGLSVILTTGKKFTLSVA